MKIKKQYLYIVIGYIIGRLGHFYQDLFIGCMPSYHHWIWGALSVLLSFIPGNKYNNFLLYFGIGLLISDLNDLLNFRFIGNSPSDLNPNKILFGID